MNNDDKRLGFFCFRNVRWLWPVRPIYKIRILSLRIVPVGLYQIIPNHRLAFFYRLATRIKGFGVCMCRSFCNLLLNTRFVHRVLDLFFILAVIRFECTTFDSNSALQVQYMLKRDMTKIMI